MGAPSQYTQQIADTICDRIANGESLIKICDDKDMPVKSTVLTWLRNNEQFQTQYVRAREDQAEHFLDEIIAISDFTAKDTIETENGGLPDNEWIQRSKLRVDARKWAMSKMAPKKYGDKVQQEHSGKIAMEQITGMRVE